MLKRLDEWLNRVGPGTEEKTNPNSKERILYGPRRKEQ
jgi:hypothetical protein